jgi:GNAT superfamily N-acetyltransferase
MGMNLQIRVGNDQDVAELVRLSLLAWEPVYDSFRQVLGPTIFTHIFPDWRQTQTETIKTYCNTRPHTVVWVAELDERIVGFFVYELNHKTEIGEVVLLAVHPDYQNRGIGTELNNFALAKLKESGMKLAEVGTGGDPGHAAARRSYEKAGYTALPTVRYYKAL